MSGSYSDDYYTSYWLGLGLPANVASVYTTGNDAGVQYSTILQEFVNQGYIQSNTFSLWLDPEEMQTGHLLLGGINSKRYKGSLIELNTTMFEAKTVSQFVNFFCLRTPGLVSNIC